MPSPTATRSQGVTGARTLHSSSFAATSGDPGGVNILLMNGDVRFCRDIVDLAVWQAISTRYGKEVVSSDSFQEGRLSL